MSADWRSGPPPSRGWWIASQYEFSDMLRWWDGTNWSAAVHEESDVNEAAVFAKRQSGIPIWHIKWMPRPESWPARSRT